MSKESETLWNEWLKTPDGSGYEAGWIDYQSSLHAARGHEWVARKMIASRDAKIAKLLAACEAIWNTSDEGKASQEAWGLVRDAINAARETTS